MSDIVKGKTPKGLSMALPAGVVLEPDAPVQDLATPEKGCFKNDNDSKIFMSFIQSEIDAVSSNRTSYLEKVKKWEKQRRAKPEQEIKNEPFEKSANVSPPVTASRVNTVYAKLLANMSAKRPFWDGLASDTQYKPNAEAVAKLLNGMSKSPFHLDLDRKNKNLLYTVCSIGTQFYDIDWEFERTQDVDPVTNAVVGLKPRKNGLAIHPINIEDFYTRLNWPDIQTSPWIAKKITKTWNELKQLESQGTYWNVDLIAGEPSTEVSDIEENRASVGNYSLTKDSTNVVAQMFDLYVVWAYWDLEGKGELTEIMCVFEPKTQTILMSKVNDIGIRPVGRLVYFDIPGQLYGAGLCEQLELLQDEVETLHNLRLDNLRWAMLNQYKTRRDSGVQADEKAYPGKIWLLDNMDDLEPMLTPDLSMSSYQAEALANNYADRISGVNDAIAGFADQTLKSGGGATAQQTMAMMSSSILSAEFQMLEDSYSEMGRMLLIMLVRYKDMVDFSFVQPDEQALIEEVLNLDPQMVPLQYKFTVKTTDAARTEEAKKQNFGMFTQMYDNYGSQVGQYVGLIVQGAQIDAQIGFPFVQQFALKMISGKTKVMEAMIGFLDIGRPEDFLPDVSMIAQLGGQNGAGGATPGGSVTGAGVGAESTGMGQGTTGGMGGDSALPPGAGSAPV